MRPTGRNEPQDTWPHHRLPSPPRGLALDDRALQVFAGGPPQTGLTQPDGEALQRLGPPAPRIQRPRSGPDDDRHCRLISPYTHESDTSPFTTQSSRNVPSRTNPSFSSTRADAILRVSASAWTRFRSSVSNAHRSRARAASVA